MSFKKLIQPLKDTLEIKGFNEPLAFQKKIIPKIKGGSSLFGVGPKGIGKTTSLVLSVIQKLKNQSEENAPRAIIVVKDKQAALALEETFNAFTQGTELLVYTLYEERNIDDQREEIYLGTDIIIATPKRLNKLYFLNGINLNKLQLFIVEDADLLLGGLSFTDITRIPESIGKCQYLIFADKYDNRFNTWRDKFMPNAQIVKA